MKKLLLSALLTLAMCATAMAASQDTKFFTIDVPDGYAFAKEAISNGGETVNIVSKDGNAALVIVYAPRDGAAMGDIAKVWEKEMGITAAKNPKGSTGDSYTLEGTVDGIALMGFLNDEGADYSLFLYIGDDPLIDKAVDSVVWK